MIRLLVINPNSSEKVTKDMENILPSIPGVSYEFYTAPQEAPKEIHGEETSIASNHVVLPDLISKKLLHYDGYLVCCYSDHPLVYALTEYTSKPILGILHGSLIYSMLDLRIKNLMIITSNNSWNLLLDKSVTKLLRMSTFPSFMAKTRSLDISVVQLNNPDVYEIVAEKVEKFLKEEPQVNCVLLGCAGMVGLNTKLEQRFGIKFVDSVSVSAELLASLVRSES